MSDISKKIITRFPPSPTGNLHVGSARTALFNYLYAKSRGGKMILRIEDTDKERSKKEFENNIIDGLAWLQIEHDDFYRQSERTDIYAKYIQKLIDEDKAYISKEEVKKEGDRREVIRFRNQGEVISFKDMVRGEITFDTTELGDFVIAKDINTPLYHLAVVVDDYESNITHVIRGEDGISNTPRQILIQKAIDAPTPQYAHIPLIFGSDKSKLSKRHGALSILEYKKEGYISDAMINFLALLGWNPGSEQEIFTLEQLISEFNIKKVQKGGAVFNTEKLKWVNKQHLRKLPSIELEQIVLKSLPESITETKCCTSELIKKITPIIMERINFLGDLKDMIREGELNYYFSEPTLDIESILWKKEPSFEKTKNNLDNVTELLSSLESNNWNNSEKIKECIWDYAENKGRGDVLWPMRYALSGRDRSPDPFTLARVLGKDETIKRLKMASTSLAEK